ncbi:MAG: sensor histidine kinase KdpD [Gemmatimonadales bacterium]|nr:sensor histidine kinase KdpD [Gemmatimonadales bacterium]
MTRPGRPDPDALLARIAPAEASATPRGRLKVFVGASPGVGKTFTMLEHARQKRAEGIDVLVGIVETHGRADTARLLDGLEVLRRRALPHRGTVLEEFDLDAALARRPGLLLVDELAHTNAPGSRHARRWQDVEELLAAGIDVCSTLNVQHLESLNDVVARITGVTVRETVPDAVLDAADEVELVDVTPEVLEQRLREGKVYLPAQAERALERFFRRPNLVALRELALRRTAERVDVQLRGERAASGATGPWEAAERLLVAIGPDDDAARLVRAARRLAGSLRAPWTALYVEEPGHATLPAARRELAQDALRLAEELGGAAATVPGHDAADEIAAWAGQHNVTRVLVGGRRAGWLGGPWPQPMAQRLAARAPALDVLRVGGDAAPSPPPAHRTAPFRLRPWLVAAGTIAACTAGALPFRGTLAEIDAAMLYLLAVVLVALREGRGPSAFAAALAVAAFDLAFVQPYGTFSVDDVRFLFTFAMMFGIALALAGLATRVREQADAARQRERRTAALYAMSRDLAAARSRPELARAMLRHLHDLFGGGITLLLPDAEGRLDVVAERPVGGHEAKDLGVARWVFERGEPAGTGTDTLPQAGALYLPLATADRRLGVVGLRPEPADRFDDLAQRRLAGAMLDQVAIALERTALADEKRQVHLEYEAERLRSSLLGSLSHDLRTPLAAVEGAASALLTGGARVPEPRRRELAETIVGEAHRMTRLVTNLLDMVRLESGAIAPARQWHVLEEVVGAALGRVESALTGREVTVSLPPDLPLVPIDDVLIGQVLINLLENAARHTPEGTPIAICATAGAGEVEVTVADRGPGVPAAEREAIFEKFHRAAGGAGGTGLGLAICRGIVTAHGGRIRVEPRDGGGAAFRFTLPMVGTPPVTEPEPA